MPASLRPSRTLLLTTALVAACAAAGPQDSAPAATAGDILVGRFALGRADLPVAANNLLNAQRADPGDRDLRQDALQAAILAGRPEAMDLARGLPDSPAADLLLANADIAARHWPDAAARFAALPGQGAAAVLRPLLQAWAQQGGGDTDAALATLQEGLQAGRFRGVFALNAALICDQSGRTAEAGRLYRLALVEQPDISLRLAQLVASFEARSGQVAEARSLLGSAIQSNPDLALAGPALLQGVAAAPVATAVDGVAEVYLAVANTLRQQNAADLAFVMLQLALRLRPDLTPARLLGAALQASTGDAAGALQMLAPVPPSDPLAAAVEIKRAEIEEQLGQMQAASASLERLVAAFPDSPQPLSELGGLQRRTGHFAQAAATFGRAIDLLGTPRPEDWAIFYEQGIAYDRAQQWPRAEADFTRALTLQPDQPYVLNYLGYAWTERGEHLAEARQMVQRAVELRPNDGSIVDSLGWVLFRQGDRAGAVRYLERAAELQPEDPEINGHLGDAYMAVGRKREAEVQWRRALVLHPDPAETTALEEKLSQASHAGSTTSAHRTE